MGLAPRRTLSPEFDYMSPFAVLEAFGGFKFVHEIDTGSSLPPLIFASDTYYLHASRIVSHQKQSETQETPEQIAHSAVRTWVGNEGHIHKTELASIDYLERSQVAQEAMFLQQAELDGLPAEMFPRVKHWSMGRAVVELVRESIPGIPIDTKRHRRFSLIQQFHAACRQYSALGLFHNDLRPWNLLSDGDAVRLIDFADVSTYDSDPTGLSQIGAYIGTILVLSGLLGVTPQNFSSVVSQLLPKAPHGVSWADLWLSLPPSLPQSVFLENSSIEATVDSLFRFITKANP
jgi:hypothetical protein